MTGHVTRHRTHTGRKEKNQPALAMAGDCPRSRAAQSVFAARRGTSASGTIIRAQTLQGCRVKLTTFGRVSASHLGSLRHTSPARAKKTDLFVASCTPAVYVCIHESGESLLQFLNRSLEFVLHGLELTAQFLRFVLLFNVKLFEMVQAAM